MKEKPISDATRIVDSVTFRPFRVSPVQYEWRSDDGRCSAWSPTYRDSHRAAVDKIMIKTRFRSLENAMKAAVKVAKARGAGNDFC